MTTDERPVHRAGPAPQDAGSIRERKKRETRARIHRAALSLALDRGLHEVTADDIAAAATVSPRTLFNYFPTKEDAFVGYDPDAGDRLAGDVLARPAEEPLDVAVRAVVTAHVVALAEDEELWRMRRRLAELSPELADRLSGAGSRLESALVRAAYERTGADPATDIRPGVTARTAMAAVRAAFDQHRTAGMSGSLTRRLDAAFDAAGLARPR